MSAVRCWRGPARGELSPIGPLLYIGQRTHSDKLASFGLGHYERSIDSNLRKDQQTA